MEKLYTNTIQINEIALSFVKIYCHSEVESETFTIDCDKKHWLEIETCINIQSNGAICKLRIPF